MKNIVLVIAFVALSINLNAQQRGQGGQGMRNGGSGQKPSPEEILKRLDTDNDGLISKSEANEARNGKMAENFDTIDANSDGFIDEDELKSGKRKKPSADQFMKDIDANEDGNLDELEVAASENLPIKNNFSKIDTNEDGVLSKTELDSFLSKGKKRKKNKK